VRCSLDAHKPALAGHPWHFASYNNLLNAYLHTDPAGHAPAIQQALDYMDTAVPPGTNAHRYVMLGRKREFGQRTGRFDDARAVAHEQLALCASDPSSGQATWHATYVHCGLAWLAWRADDWEGVAGHAAQAEECARARGQECELAEALAWQAAVARRQGDEAAAGRALRSATARLARVAAVPAWEYHDARCAYYELGGDLRRAVQWRRRELEAVAGKGRLGYECRLHTERCRLLSLLGKLTAADVEAARAAALRLRQPASYLAELERVTGDGGPAGA
jgi:hypothetical protein